MVHGGSRIFVISFRELPSWPSFIISFRVWFYDRNIDVVCETFDISDKVCAMSEGTE